MSDEAREDEMDEAADAGFDPARPAAEASSEDVGAEADGDGGGGGEDDPDDSVAEAVDGDGFAMPEFGASGPGGGAAGQLSMLDDVALKVSVELGRTRMHVEDVLRLIPEAVIELDKAAGDPVDVFVNGRHVARGEVLVLNENFCVRINEVIRRSDSDS